MRAALRTTLLAALLCATPATADEVLVDGIAAQVGTDIVLVSEVMELARPREQAMRQANAPEQQIAQARADALETVIEWRLIEQMVKQAELYATEAEIDTTIEAIAGENGLTLDQLKRSVLAQNMRWASYKSEIKRELERRKIVNAMVAAQVTIDDSELESLYAERFSDQPDSGSTIHLRQILTVGGEANPNRSVEEACDLVRRARASITTGRDFSEFATRYSAVAPERGGDLGWMHTDELAGYLKDLVAGLEPGQLSPVHEIPVGCTLVQLVERREFRPISFDEAKPKLRTELFEQKMMVEYREWMEQLRARTFIERRGYFADAADFAKDVPEGSEFEAGMRDFDVIRGESRGEEAEAAP